MKFGKQIQSQQIPGFTSYYLDYKFLKKIINSLDRPASELAALAAGIRPASATPLLSSSSSGHSTVHDPLSETALPPPFSQPDSNGILPAEEDEGPLPPSSTPPTPSFGANRRGSRDGFFTTVGANHPNGVKQAESETLLAHRTVFFFKLEREMEKINAFYLQKERDLRLRLLTLISARKRLLRSSRGALPSEGASAASGSGQVEWKALEEGWRVFERDLGKLQQFIEINAIGFRKILKKWDKRSKSSTKELYLQRQVEVQPCFNRQFIARLSDIVAANLLDIITDDDLLGTELATDLPDDALDSRLKFDISADASLDALSDLDSDLADALSTRDRETILRAFVQVTEDSRALSDNRAEVERILWKGVLEVGDDMVDAVVAVIGPALGWHAVDAINGRTLLHQASITGSLGFARHCVERGIDISRRDSYDRTALHYATMNGHASLVSFLLSSRADPSAVDMDGYTPLIHSIVNGQIDCVRILLDLASPTIIEPTAVSNDLIPLSLACQHGHLEVARLLLRKGAKTLPNSEGLYPQHLAARDGHDDICELLVREGGPAAGGKDRADKYNEWTPLFHAATGDAPSHVRCVQVLVDAGCDVNAIDEYGKTSLFYAAYYGHVGSVDILLRAGAVVTANKLGFNSRGKAVPPPLTTSIASLESQTTSLSPGSDLDPLDLDDPMDGDGDGDLIPSLSLPPPIVPLQIYGHNYLDKRCLVQLSLGHPFSRSASLHGPSPPAVKLYGTSDSSGRGQANSWSSLKLVMTSKPDVTSVPHSVILPLADEREVFGFQVAAESLPHFSLDFSLYPTFGSKLIGRAVLLASSLDNIKTHQHFVIPLMDHHLKIIGEVAFELSVVRPFVGVQLEIGGRVETYWKSTTVPSFSGFSQDHGRQFQPHRPLSVSTSSPLLTGAPGPPPPVLGGASDNGLVTSTSLAGEYVNVIVQVTSDLVPVVYYDWALPVEGFQLGVADVKSADFAGLASRTGRTLQARTEMLDDQSSAADWFKAMESSMATLEQVMAILPLSLGVNLELRYTSSNDARRLGLSNVIEINAFVDSILQVVYEAGKASPPSYLAPSTASSSSSTRRNRKIVFSAFDPNVSSFITFKQPNYAVFFASHCGLSRTRGKDEIIPLPAEIDEEDDKRCMSVREAVKFAKANSLLGVMLDAALLAQVPHLIYSVKESGLLLATFGRDHDVALLASGPGIEGVPTVDACLKNGVIVYSF